MSDKTTSDIFLELSHLLQKKDAKYVLRKLQNITAEDYAQVRFESLKHDVSLYFGVEPHTVKEKHNKNENVYAVRVVISYILSDNTTITQARIAKMLNKDTSQVSKFINIALNLDDREPLQRKIKTAIEKFKWQKTQ